MLPSSTLTLIAALVALAVATAVAMLGRSRLGPVWAHPTIVWAGLLAGWLALSLSGSALTVIGLCLGLTAAYAAIGVLKEATAWRRPAELVCVAVVLVAAFGFEYWRGDMYALPSGIWALVGLVAFFGATFAVDAAAPDGGSASTTLARITPLAGAYFVVLGQRLPNPGLMTYGLLILTVTGVAYLATARGGEAVARVANLAMIGLLFGAGWYSWLGYASPQAAMAPFVIMCADTAWTLARRVVQGRILGGEPTPLGRLLGVLDPRDDSVYQRTAASDGSRAANADLLMATLLALGISLAEWYLKVAAVPGILPYAVLALAYVLSPGVRARRERPQDRGPRRLS